MSSPLSEPSSPLSPVDAEDLANALRRILDSAFAAPEVERAHNLLERYESQQAEASKHEHDELNAAQPNECAGCSLLRAAKSTLETGGTIVLAREVSRRETQQTEPSKPAHDFRDLLYLIVSAYSALDGAHADCDPERAHECHLRLRAHIESAMAALSNSEHSKPALSEVEQIAVKLLAEYTRWSNTGECSCDLIELSEQLREALRKRGAL